MKTLFSPNGMQGESSSLMMISLIIMLTIEGYNTRRVLVDNGSSADVMYMKAFQQMKLDPKCLRNFESPLVSFSGWGSCIPKGHHLPIDHSRELSNTGNKGSRLFKH